MPRLLTRADVMALAKADLSSGSHTDRLEAIATALGYASARDLLAALAASEAAATQAKAPAASGGPGAAQDAAVDLASCSADERAKFLDANLRDEARPAPPFGHPEAPVVGYQVIDLATDLPCGDRPTFEVLSFQTALADLRAAMATGRDVCVEVVRVGHIEEPSFA